MQAEQNKVLRENEIKKDADFFEIFHNVFNGVMLRKDIQQLFPTKYKTRFRNWYSCNLISDLIISGNHFMVLKYNKQNTYLRQRELTGDRLLRSAMRFKYYYEIQGLHTPEAIKRYSEKGNDRVNRNGLTMRLLTSYEEAFLSRGIVLPNLNSSVNVSLLNRMSLRNVFVSKMMVKGGVIVPLLVVYSYRDQTPSQIAKQAVEAYRGIQDIFSDATGTVEIRPCVKICRFVGTSRQAVIQELIGKEKEFISKDREELEAIFPIVEVSKSIRYIDHTQII